MERMLLARNLVSRVSVNLGALSLVPYIDLPMALVCPVTRKNKTKHRLLVSFLKDCS